MSLLSGGIDSPVAAWRLIRRGCRAHFVHFHSYPILSSTSQEKVRELVKILTRSQLRSRLYLVPVWGHPAAGRDQHPTGTAGRRVPAPDDADCGEAGHHVGRARAGDG